MISSKLLSAYWPVVLVLKFFGRFSRYVFPNILEDQFILWFLYSPIFSVRKENFFEIKKIAFSFQFFGCNVPNLIFNLKVRRFSFTFNLYICLRIDQCEID